MAEKNCQDGRPLGSFSGPSDCQVNVSQTKPRPLGDDCW